jgi:tetratricopeptide (TPR) repeat protein
MQGRSAEAIRWSRAAIEAAELADDQKALAQAYYVLDWAYMELGRTDEAVSLPLALRIYEDLADLANQAVVREMMGVFAYNEGRWEAGRAVRARQDRLRAGWSAGAQGRRYVQRRGDPLRPGPARGGRSAARRRIARLAGRGLAFDGRDRHETAWIGRLP